jgi:hypothetical protein
VQQVELEIAAREHIRPIPGVAHRVDRQSRLPAGDEVVAVSRVNSIRERSGCRVLTARGRSAQQQIDGVRHQLDVSELFSRDVRDEVVERAHLGPATEVERLKRVVHQRRHLAELSAKQFLHGRR